jgi:HEPN domain-containing protein
MKERPENFKIIEEWKEVARMDWQRVRRNLRDQDSIAAGFYLQQSIEKFLKAFLIAHRWELKKIHRLDTLLDEAINYNKGLKTFYKLCERVSGYYRADRYPPLGVIELTTEDIEKDMGEAKKLIQTLSPEEELNG